MHFSYKASGLGKIFARQKRGVRGMRWLYLCLAIVASGVIALEIHASAADQISPRARALHFRSIVIDTHDDTTQRLLWDRLDLSLRSPDGHIDIPRMREGGLGGIFFSIWIPGTVTGPEAVKRALDQIDAVRQQVRLHPKDLILATTAADIRRAHAEGKIAALMGVEGGHMIAGDLGVLRTFAALGVRYMTLTHSVNDEWADSSTDKPVHNGLTGFGKDVVREMNRLGMIVDISHVSDKTFYDALAVSQAPMIASHSSCRALCDVPRDMTDDMIRALAAKGGVIQINYHIGFLSQEFANASKAIRDEMKARTDEAAKKCGENEACQIIEGDRVVRQFVSEGKLPRVGWEKIIEHIDHAVKVGGVDHVGLGSDFDGADMPYGMDDVSHLPQITDALLKKGYSESDVQKILGGNTLRVMEQVETVAKRLGGQQ
jgi:membrane dipeptidase